MQLFNGGLKEIFEGGIKGKKIRFIGIGGVGVNALAKYCLTCGAKVSGSDRKINDLCKEIIALGGDVYEGEDPNFDADTDAVVFSSAINADNKELVRAKDLGIKTYERHEFLRLIACEYDKVVGIAGSHGKTTVTAMLTHILKCANKNFVSMIGGEAIKYSNFVNNTGDGDAIFVTEACEYRRHMLTLDADVAVVLNTDWDHPDSYPDALSVKQAFKEFLDKATTKVAEGNKDNSVIVTGDNQIVFEYEKESGGARVFADGELVGNISDKEQGDYNLKNALFAIATASVLGVRPQTAVKAINTFEGVKRRFEKVGDLDGKPIIFDFAHHPTEIKNLLERANNMGRLLVVFQPHTYSRTKAYMNDFAEVFADDKNGVETLIICPTYAAREALDATATSDILADAILSKNAEKRVYIAKSAVSTIEFVNMMIKRHDAVLFVGAGDIYELKKYFVES